MAEDEFGAPLVAVVTIEEQQRSDPPDIVAARTAFLKHLTDHLTTTGKMYRKVPIMRNREMDLFRLYWYVGQRDGYVEVTKALRWLEICKSLLGPLQPSTGSSTKLRETYERYLLDYEQDVGYTPEVFGTIEPALVGRKMATRAEERFLSPAQLRRRHSAAADELTEDGSPVIKPQRTLSTSSLTDGSGSPNLSSQRKRLKRLEDGHDSPNLSLSSSGTKVKKRSQLICDHCHRYTYIDTDVIVECAGCHRGFHQTCHAPQIEWVQASVNHVDWYCADCVMRRRRDVCARCNLTSISNINALVVCQRCCHRWHRLCLDVKPEELKSPVSPINTNAWFCPDCTTWMNQRSTDLSQKSERDLCVHVQQLWMQNERVNLERIMELSRVSVQKCTDTELVLWALNLNGPKSLTLDELLATIYNEFGVEYSDRTPIQAAMHSLMERAVIEKLDNKYRICNNVTLGFASSSTG